MLPRTLAPLETTTHQAPRPLTHIPILDGNNWAIWERLILLAIFARTRVGWAIVTGRQELPANCLAEEYADLWAEACIALEIIVSRIRPEDYARIDRWCEQEQTEPYHKYHPRSIWVALESMCHPTLGLGCTVS